MDIITNIAIIGLLILVVFILALLEGFSKGAPYTPMRKKVIRRMFAMAALKPGEIVYDLGSGDGRVVVAAAKEFGARGVGIETTYVYVLWSRTKALLKGVHSQVRIMHGDVFKADISKADVVVLFLLQDTNARIKHKLLTELKPGTRVCSHYFTFADWEVAKKDEVHHITMYVVPDAT